MKRPELDPQREERIHNEAIVDARPEEQAMGWYYYLDDKIDFPFQARCIETRDISPLNKDETVEALGMASEDDCEHDMLVMVSWEKRKMAVPLSQLAPVDVDEATEEAIGDSRYWVARGYLL